MILINHNLKAIYIKIPNCGGKYISNILIKYYGFEDFLKIPRDDITDFFETDEQLIQSIEFFSGDIFSIRKLGILRYFINHEDNNISQEMTKEKWNEYYKFTFIRNPYERFINGFYYFKNKKIKDSSKTDYNNIKEFIDDKENISNVYYFNTLITQKDHLIDYDEKLNINYIGKLDNINNDIIKILHHIGIKDIIHNKENIEIEKKFYFNKFDKFDKITTQEILELNELLSDDFLYFDFKKFNSSDELSNYYINNYINNDNIYDNNNDNNNDNNDNIYKNCFYLDSLEKNNEELCINTKNYIIEFMNNIDIMFDISGGNFSFIQQKQNLLNHIDKILNNKLYKKNNIFYENVSKFLYNNNDSFKKENCEIKCLNCNQFISYNLLSIKSHNINCNNKKII